MAVETELKLRIAPENLARLKRHPLLKTLATTRATTRKLYNIYYDTPQLELHKSAMALRLRHIGKQWLQTLKGGGRMQAGLHQRNEWETPVAGKALDFAAMEASGAKRLPPDVRKKLQPVFVTDFSRSSRTLVFNGAEIELCMDSGKIRVGRRTKQISELELELKSGEPAQLFELALALLDIVPLEVEHVSKAEQGYRLFAQVKPAVARAATPDLAQSSDVPSALQAMIGSCLFHLQGNVSGAVHKLDDEYLHQVRVALRRLRVALGMAKIFRADDGLAALRKDIAALCVELGLSREWDVFVTQTLAPIRARLPGHAGLHKVLHTSGQLRAQHHAKVRNALQSQEFQRLLLRIGAWMHGDYWRGQAAAEGLILSRFAAQVLEKRSKQVSKLGRELARADIGQLHALRIACKRLRYSAELFASLFGAARARRYLAALTQLQDILGTLNDIAIAHRLLGELENEERHDTLTLIRGWMEHDYAERMTVLGKAWKKFFGQKIFW